ncbi:type II toxin-antitoxin system RelE/ParE family toxin [Candidatus Bathyarchaeota archaeon]|nr:MAG: type II toxin-antitoxin system RelE/ParE family toxin [Candidatus Bathyarchaeota archaeon]
MFYEVYFERKTLKSLEKLDKTLKSRILEALRTLRDEGFSRKLDIKKLKGYKNHYRLRIGNHRILFELQKPKTIIIYAILPREKAYENK